MQNIRAKKLRQKLGQIIWAELRAICDVFSVQTLLLITVIITLTEKSVPTSIADANVRPSLWYPPHAPSLFSMYRSGYGESLGRNLVAWALIDAALALTWSVR